MCDPISDYRDLFREAYEDEYDIKPTLMTMFDHSNDFWTEYYRKKRSNTWKLGTEVINFHDVQHINALKTIIMADISISMPITEFINDSMRVDNLADAEFILKFKVGDIGKYNFTISEFVTNGHVDSSDIMQFILFMLHEKTFKAMKIKTASVKALKRRKNLLYKKIEFKDKEIEMLKHKME